MTKQRPLLQSTWDVRLGQVRHYFQGARHWYEFRSGDVRKVISPEQAVALIEEAPRSPAALSRMFRP